MAVVLRCQRRGRKNRAFFRVVAADERAKSDGRIVENLGFYDPLARDDAKRLVLNAERVQHWIAVGAQITDTVRSLCHQRQIAIPVPKRRRRERPAGKIGVGGPKSPKSIAKSRRMASRRALAAKRAAAKAGAAKGGAEKPAAAAPAAEGASAPKAS